MQRKEFNKEAKLFYTNYQGEKLKTWYRNLAKDGQLSLHSVTFQAEEDSHKTVAVTVEYQVKLQSGSKKVSQIHRMVVGFREQGVTLITIYPKSNSN